MIRVFLSLIVVIGSIGIPACSQDRNNEEHFLVGPSDIKSLSPVKVIQDYQSVLFPNQKVTIEYQGSPKSLRIFQESKEILISDPVFKELDGILVWFILEEYQKNLGSKKQPIRCLQLSFDVDGNEVVASGSVEICETEPARIRLEGYKENDFSNVIYDSALSSEYNLDGFWKEVPD